MLSTASWLNSVRSRDPFGDLSLFIIRFVAHSHMVTAVITVQSNPTSPSRVTFALRLLSDRPNFGEVHVGVSFVSRMITSLTTVVHSFENM